MELRDFMVTPLVLFVVYAAMFALRPYVTDAVNRRYFIPALSVRIFGAIILGFIYQFYYGGGDTFNFHSHGSRIIWEAFMESPLDGFKLLFSDGSDSHGVYQYASRISSFGDPNSYFIVRVAAICDLLTFSSYSATAILFATINFAGMWMFFLTFYRRYPDLHMQIAIATFFIPSVFFWGSGILKDTLMMACLGIIVYEIDKLLLRGKVKIGHILLLFLALYSVFLVRKFVLQAFLPCALLWIYMNKFRLIHSFVLRALIFPFVILVGLLSLYYTAAFIGEGDKKYAIGSLSQTSKVTAYDIRFQTGRDAGSGYTLGELDGTFESMLRLAPQAVNVSLFRPYLWEVRNPFMFLSALESLCFLTLILLVFIRRRSGLLAAFRDSDVIFCFSFALIYAFAVGVSSFNFGTLVRYKIPMMPFFALAIILAYYKRKVDKQLLPERKITDPMN